MKKFLSILLAVLMVAGLVPALLAGAATGTADQSTAITADKSGRIYHYYESFDTDTVVQGADKVIDTLGWFLPSGASFVKDHEANVTATEKDAGAYMYEIKNGRLYLRNRGSKNEYMFISNAQEMAEVLNGACTVEYTLTYLASSSSKDDGYMSFIYKADDQLVQYAEAVIRISGWGNHQLAGNFSLDCGDVSTKLLKECGLTAYRVDNNTNMTLYEKLCGDVDNVPGTTNVLDIRGSKLMVDVEMRVRMEFDGMSSPCIYVNDVLVSDPRNIRDDTARILAQAAYQEFTVFEGAYLGFCVTPGIDCVVDEITVYEKRGEIGSALYITEIATLPENPLAPFIEVYNAGTEAVDLAAYAAGYVTLDADGTEHVQGAALSAYIGQSLTVGETVLDNLSAKDAVLSPGEAVLLYPVDVTANVADLIATVDGVTLAGFRAEYGLSADAKVLAITSETFQVEAIEHRYWFVGDAKDDKGKNMAWDTYSLQELKNSSSIQSIVELVPSIAFGYDGNMADTSVNTDGAYNFGGDGYVQSGYSAHYIYGVDVSSSDKVGLLVSRGVEPIKEQNNVGKLLAVQADYFEKISEYRSGNYNDDGALVITEFIPVTDENDAFESFELTNISTEPINLYDFGLVSSGDAKYGDLNAWTRASVFEPNPVRGITNPYQEGAYMIASGASVIVWNMTAEGHTLSEFRNCHKLAANVPVIVVNSMNEKSVVAANSGTVSYGVASATDINAFLNGTTAQVAKAVSDVTVPLNSIHYEIDGLYKYTWQDLYEAGNMTILSAMVAQGLQGCEMLGVQLQAGERLDGYFTRELVDGKYLYAPCEAGTTVPENNTVAYYTVKDIESFIAYGAKQSLEYPVNHAVAFSYGCGIFADKTSGSLMNTLKVNSYNYDANGRGFGDLPYLLDVANRFVTIDLISGASATHTLGSVEDKQGVTVIVKSGNYYAVTYLDGNGQLDAMLTLNANTCHDVYTILSDEYDTWLVNDVFYQAGDVVSIDGETVIKPGILGVSAQVNHIAPASSAPAVLAVEELNMSPNSIAPAAANGLTALIVVISVLGAAMIATACVIVVKKRREE
ncbi:MAG: hypothetical protein E7585_04780 [Ruminococcaceae bacterium]|nr:hypothetical protein [Oscillospiraceae bacterium]